MSASRAGSPLTLTRVAGETAKDAMLPSRARNSICVASIDWTIPWSFVRPDGADRPAAGAASASTVAAAVSRRRWSELHVGIVVGLRKPVMGRA